MNTEIRSFKGVEVRQGPGTRPRLVGYAALWDARSLDLGGFVEILRRGAFTRSLSEHPDLRAFVDHDPAMIIGRVSADTLRVQEDAKGLKVEIFPPDTQVGRDVVENVRVGNLDGMSFAFTLYDRDTSERWHFKEKPPVREILEARIYEASVVAMPAYPDTTVAVRSMSAKQGRTVAELQAAAETRAAGWR
jgi:HK97 family phage prohead protease